MGSGGLRRKRRRHLPKVRGDGQLADGTNSNWFGGYGEQPWGFNSRTVHRSPSKRAPFALSGFLVGAALAALLVIAVIAVFALR